MSKSAAIEIKPQKENAMDLAAEKKESAQNGQRMPVEIYASSLAVAILKEDVRFAERQLEQGLPRHEAVRNLTGDHVRRAHAELSTLPLAERHAANVTDVVRQSPHKSTDQVLEALRPSGQDLAHWKPAVSAIGPSQADTLLWKREHRDIQSYQQCADPRGWLHIDSAGQFMDRGVRVISAEQALTSIGLTTSEAIERGRLGASKETAQNAGLGVSF